MVRDGLVQPRAPCHDLSMSVQLLERHSELEVLDAAVRAAVTGTGSVVLVSGEAGIGKTSVIRAFRRGVDGTARILQGACDDLITPRTLGPLRDAVAGGGGPLAAALAAGNRDDVLAGVVAELSDPAQPTVLVVEDVHWADDATIDVLTYVGRRIVDVPAVLVITYRDDEIARDHPAQRLLGALGGNGAYRLALHRLSRSAVAVLAGGTAATSAGLFQLTGGNPFFLSELLAVPRERSSDVPETIADAVLARVHSLGGPTQLALDQLAVVPSQTELRLARELVGDLTVLAEAERRGVIEVRPDAIAFRHELARRAVESSLPTSLRMQLNGRVLAALRATGTGDLPRLVHHAVEAGDDAAVVEFGPQAAVQAGAAGAHGQEIRFYETVLQRRVGLTPTAEGEVLLGLGHALFSMDRMEEARDAELRAIAIWERLGDTVRLAESLTAIAPVYWVEAKPAEALRAGRRAVALLEPDGDTAQLAFAMVFLGLLYTAVGDGGPALGLGRSGLAVSRRIGAPDLEAMFHSLIGRARWLTGDSSGLEEMKTGLRMLLSSAVPNHVFVMMTYVVIVQDLFDSGQFTESEWYVDEGLNYALEREFAFYVDHLLAHRLKLQAVRGDWPGAVQGLRALVGNRSAGEPSAVRYALPALAQLLVRLDADDAEDMLSWAADFAKRAGSPYEWLPVRMTQIERAWLGGTPGSARAAIEHVERLTSKPGQEPARAALLRWRKRLGDQVEVFPGCPDVLAAGIRGDWRTAADGWADRGVPYGRAQELVDSGDVDATGEALTIFDQLGAAPAAEIARRRLRDLGGAIPRRPQPGTRANPAGLTDRQVEILSLVAKGHTNAEIAADLVVSVRTVDHHVSAVLQKLGLTSRRHVARAAAELGIG